MVDLNAWAFGLDILIAVATLAAVWIAAIEVRASARERAARAAREELDVFYKPLLTELDGFINARWFAAVYFPTTSEDVRREHPTVFYRLSGKVTTPLDEAVRLREKYAPKFQRLEAEVSRVLRRAVYGDDSARGPADILVIAPPENDAPLPLAAAWTRGKSIPQFALEVAQARGREDFGIELRHAGGTLSGEDAISFIDDAVKGVLESEDARAVRDASVRLLELAVLARDVASHEQRRLIATASRG